MDRMTARWLVFSAVKDYPRDTNEIMDELYQRTGNFDDLRVIAMELQALIDAGVVLIHAEDDIADILEVRLNNVAA